WRPHLEGNPPPWATDCPGDAFPDCWFRRFQAWRAYTHSCRASVSACYGRQECLPYNASWDGLTVLIVSTLEERHLVEIWEINRGSRSNPSRSWQCSSATGPARSRACVKNWPVRK